MSNLVKITNDLTMNNNQLVCWCDGHTFSGAIYHYPVKKTSDGYWGHGVFCSLACAKRFILMKYDGQYNILKLFENMIREQFHICQVYAAPNPYIITTFSPNLSPPVTIEQYRTISTLPSVIITSHETDALLITSSTTQAHDGPTVFLCWHDGHPCTTPSVPICTQYTDGPIVTFEVIGHFCSLNCAKRYLIDRMCTMRPLLTLFSIFCHIVYRIDPCSIIPAQSPYDLRQYLTSNHRTISDFRSNFIYPIPDNTVQIIRKPTYVYSSTPHISQLESKSHV
jgi:hypothetical protein